MTVTMLPERAALPDVLPSERLTRSGMPVPEVRAELRRIPNGRNVVSVAVLWAEVVGAITAAAWLHQWWSWVAVFLLMGTFFARFAILGHEAAHRLLFTHKAGNDRVGKWLLSYPAFVPFDIYRRAHFAHHREEFGPNEPDLSFYDGYPAPPSSMRRKLSRDAIGISGWKNLRPLLTAGRSQTARPLVARILGTQAVILLAFTLAGRPELYLFLWLAPWMTVWRVLNRLRSIAEHGGMTRSPDRRLTTHHVRQHWLARFSMVPYNTGWHLAHHVDMGVPWRNLPRLHAELVRAGWVTPLLEYPSYLALWRRLASGTEAEPATRVTTRRPRETAPA